MSKSIVITGAGSGLGRALARALAAQAHTLILLARTLASVEAVASELGGGALAVACDVGRADSVRTAFASISARHPRIDVLINNAAIYEPLLVRDATDAQIDNALQTNLAGPIHCARAVLPMMERGGHIINVSSESVGMNHAMFSLYQGSKAGLERFSEALREEVQPDGIRVTMVRAGQMMDADSKRPASPEVARRFAEENLKRGLDFRARPISSFSSAAEAIAGLLTLPDDINVPQMVLEARYP